MKSCSNINKTQWEKRIQKGGSAGSIINTIVSLSFVVICICVFIMLCSYLGMVIIGDM